MSNLQARCGPGLRGAPPAFQAAVLLANFHRHPVLWGCHRVAGAPRPRWNWGCSTETGQLFFLEYGGAQNRGSIFIPAAPRRGTETPSAVLKKSRKGRQNPKGLGRSAGTGYGSGGPRELMQAN
ncbi:hypothetical protein Chor_000059 [Crotalus horridus]